MALRKRLILLFKILVAVSAYVFVAHRLYQYENWRGISLLHRSNLWKLLVVVLLMPINWLVEASKWRYALKGIHKISVASALKTVLYGGAIGLFTPARLGDPIGRVALLKVERSVEAGTAAFQCTFAQQLATIIFGLVGVYMLKLQGKFFNVLTQPLGLVALAVSLLVTVLFVFAPEVVANWLGRLKLLKRWVGVTHGFTHASWWKSLKILCYSLFRYAIFSTQLVLVLSFLGFNQMISLAYAAVFVTYLMASIIPVVSIADAGVRSGFAIIFVGVIWNNPAEIALAVHFVWILNVALPALLAVWLPFMGNSKVRSIGAS